MRFFVSCSRAFAFVSLTLCVRASPLILPETQYDGLSELGAIQKAIDLENVLPVDDSPLSLNIENQVFDISDNNDPTFNPNGVSFGGVSQPPQSGDLHGLHGDSSETPVIHSRPVIAVPKKAQEDESTTKHKGEMCTLADGDPDPKSPTTNYMSQNLCKAPDDDSAAKSKKVPPNGSVCTAYDVWHFVRLNCPIADCRRKIQNYPTRDIAIRRLRTIAMMGD